MNFCLVFCLLIIPLRKLDFDLYCDFVVNCEVQVKVIVLLLFFFCCSQMSPIVILTMPVEIYQYGWQYILFIPVLALVMLAFCYIFLPILYINKLDNCYTVKKNQNKQICDMCFVTNSLWLNWFHFSVFGCTIWIIS